MTDKETQPINIEDLGQPDDGMTGIAARIPKGLVAALDKEAKEKEYNRSSMLRVILKERYGE
jgi:hypothetical protein